MKKTPLGELWGEDEHEAKIEEDLDRVMKDVARVKKERFFLAMLGVAIGGVSVFLIMIWFDWRLLVVIFLALFGNNLSQIK